MNKHFALLFIAILCACPSFAQQPAKQEQPAAEELPPIRNFFRESDQFCTGGQPRLEHLAKLKAEGVKVILNLRTPGEHRADEEEAKAKELGLKYFNIPVVYRDPKEEQATEFLKILDDPSNRLGRAYLDRTAFVIHSLIRLRSRLQCRQRRRVANVTQAPCRDQAIGAVFVLLQYLN